MSGTPRFVTLYGVHPSGTSIQRSGSSREIFLTASANLIRNREFHVDYLGHAHGYGHLYQGRYKCFPVETEDYFYQVVRYVERNALRPKLVERAESWRWSSLRRVEREDPAFPILSTWPLPRPTDWLQ